jgi:LysM repeat protein
VISDGRLRSSNDEEAGNSGTAPLGKGEIEAPTDEVKSLALAETDVVVVMTQSVAETIQPSQTFGSDANAICAALIEASGASREDRTVVVISGPYRQQFDSGLAEKLGDELNSLREEMQGKAGSIALLELGGKIDSLAAAVAGKADNAELLELKRDVLKFAISKKTTEEEAEQTAGGNKIVAVETKKSSGSSLLMTALVALVISLAAGFLGGWFFARRQRPAPEVWSVRTSGNQVSITRQNGATVVLDLAKPLKSTGEQTFSTFTDVKSYIDTLSAQDNVADQVSNSSQVQNQTSAAVTEVIVKPGDSLKRFALQYNVPQERIMELNPNITRWPYIKAGQKVLIPAPAATIPSPATTTQPSPQSDR